MKGKFILSCESTIDMPYAYAQEREIPVLFYTYTLDGVEYEDDMGRSAENLEQFYTMLLDGKPASTSQINTFTYTEYLENLLQQGDVLHIAFGSGMTGSVRNAWEAAESLRAKYPERKLVVLDSYCSSTGYGMLTDGAADLRDNGATLEETVEWCERWRKCIHHQFYSTDLTFYRRSGRISGPAAMVGRILNICPVMRLNDDGRIIAYDKVRGKKNALKETIGRMEAHAVGGTAYSGKCMVCHSHCPEDAEATRDAVAQHFPNINGEIRICEIGNIIASHCGPGTVAVFFFGDEREPEN